MSSYVTAVWQCRYFWWSLVKMDLRTRYRRSILGLGWSLLHPIAMTTILCFVFSEVFKIAVEDFGPYLLAGLATWNYVSTVTIQGCQCFFQGEAYIRQHPAPLAVYPLRTALGGTVHFLIALVVVIGLTGYFKGFENPACLICLVPASALLFVLGWSLAVLAGFANVLFQDTQHLSEIGFQIVFYATPVMYPASLLESSRFGWILQYNPVVPLLQLVREPILQGKVPDIQTYSTAGLIVFLAACAAGATLARLQRRLIFHL
jgi:ABC-type polysaccharide/polyol phosphate export permease